MKILMLKCKIIEKNMNVWLDGWMEKVESGWMNEWEAGKIFINLKVSTDQILFLNILVFTKRLHLTYGFAISSIAVSRSAFLSNDKVRRVTLLDSTTKDS